MENTSPAAVEVLTAVADARFTGLAKLVESGRAAASLRHVLPADESGRVAVAAFGSSI